MTIQASESSPSRPTGPAAGPAPTEPSTDGGRRPLDLGPSPLAAVLARAHERHRRADDGSVATYIPELGRADPSWFGIAAMTLDGALSRGRRQPPAVHHPVDLQAADLRPHPRRPRRGRGPGAASASSRPARRSTASRWPRAPAARSIRWSTPARSRRPVSSAPRHDDRPRPTRSRRIGRFAGRPLTVDRDVLDSERATGHRNRAIAHLLRASGAIDGDADAVVERYFSPVLGRGHRGRPGGDRRDLANGGVHPLTGERVLSTATHPGRPGGHGHMRDVRRCRRVAVHGRAAGQERRRPAGSSSSCPGGSGSAVFSPPLDANGNSVRGVRVCRDLVRDLGLHPLRTERAAAGRRPGDLPPVRRRLEASANAGPARRPGRARPALPRRRGPGRRDVPGPGRAGRRAGGRGGRRAVRRGRSSTSSASSARRAGRRRPAGRPHRPAVRRRAARSSSSGRHRLAPAVAGLEQAVARAGAGRSSRRTTWTAPWRPSRTRCSRTRRCETPSTPSRSAEHGPGPRPVRRGWP